MIALLVAIVATSANADSISGEQFLDMAKKDKAWYFLGIVDATKQTRAKYAATSELEQADFDRMWEACIAGRTVRQQLAIVDAWMQQNPNRWHEPVVGLIFDAIRDSCNEINDAEDSHIAPVPKANAS